MFPDAIFLSAAILHDSGIGGYTVKLEVQQGTQYAKIVDVPQSTRFDEIYHFGSKWLLNKYMYI